MKEIRPLASLIANESDLSRYQPTYDRENKKLSTPAYKVVDLLPPIRKHTFAPEVDPSDLVDDEAEFHALNGFDWSSPTFQAAEEDKEAEKDDTKALGHQSEED